MNTARENVQSLLQGVQSGEASPAARPLIEEIEDEKTSKYKSQLGQALHAVEDESDVAAAKTAMAEASAEFAEFDENIPIDVDRNEEKSPEEEELERVVSQVSARLFFLIKLNDIEIQSLIKLSLFFKQLTPVERYAMQFLESIQEPIQAEQLKQAEVSMIASFPNSLIIKHFVFQFRIPQEEIEAQKKEWELGHLKSLKEENERALKKEQEQDEMLTMSKDEVAQVNNRFKIPNTKKVARKIVQSTTSRTPSTLRTRESTSLRRLESPAKAGGRSRISSLTSLSSADSLDVQAGVASTGRTRTSSRQTIVTNPFASNTPSRSGRVSKRSSRLNDTI